MGKMQHFYLFLKLKLFSEEEFSIVKYMCTQKCILWLFQSKAKHHAIAANLKKTFEFKDKPFIIQ